MSLESSPLHSAAVLAKASASPVKRPAESVSEQTYRALMELITSRQLEPGDVIEERRLAERFAVSRTPLRAAISRLLGEGILQQLSNGVIVVREVGLTEYLELLSVRLLLEVEAAGLAAVRAPLPALERLEARLLQERELALQQTAAKSRLDDEIHALVATHCGNPSLARFINQIHTRIRMRNLGERPTRLLPACDEHLELVRALSARDAARARLAMTAHLENVRTSYLQAAGIVVD